MSENKIAKIPVASHGLHKHSYNYPWLTSINFGDVMPCYYNPIRKGERDNPRAGVYSQLMPIAHNAFATGRYNFKAIFVPYKLVWRPWYAFDQQLDFNSNGENFRPERFPYVLDDKLTDSFIDLFGRTELYGETANSLKYDVCVNTLGNTNVNNASYYFLTVEGRRVLRILGALGCLPTFVSGETSTLNILSLLCYIKAFADYYFPNNYVGGTVWNQLSMFFERDIVDFSPLTEDLLRALSICSLNFYENSVFDFAWDNPATPNVSATSPQVNIPDATDPDGNLGSVVSNTSVSNGTPSAEIDGGFTQYVLNALKSVSMWAKRRQLSGARLLDKFLVSRGVTLPNDSARISYFIGQRNIEIEVSGVENNTDSNLGELAGRGVASSGDSPLSFECRPDDDGIFFVIVSPLPDANFPVSRDGFACRKDFLDNYTAEYDKLGTTAVPKRVILNTPNGFYNEIHDPSRDGVFGFLNQYWDEVQEKPRLLGDFILQYRGAKELQSYHTFRVFNDMENIALLDISHSLDFIKMWDNNQYQRLFYSDKQENLMLFMRWFGNQYKEKLPIGDSYDWDDDELNRKVSVIVGGSQK